MYPASPINRQSAIQYAEYLTELHGIKWVALERVSPINNRYVANFAAEKESSDDLDYYLNSGEWKVIVESL